MKIALDVDMTENTPKIVFPSVQKSKILMPPTKFCRNQLVLLQNTHSDPYFARFNAKNIMSKIEQIQ